uniref:Cold shock domain containing C2 n=1 Tax=Cyprinus carpio TaxID=7962 RepID=A0A8C1QVM7_CYPCA
MSCSCRNCCALHVNEVLTPDCLTCFSESHTCSHSTINCSPFADYSFLQVTFSSLCVCRTVRANVGPVFKGVCKNFSRSQGHGFIRPAHGGEDIFVHISDIEGEYVPVEGDEVTYKVCPVPPKNVKVQAMEVIITHLRAGTKHETWSGQIIRS